MTALRRLRWLLWGMVGVAAALLTVLSSYQFQRMSVSPAADAPQGEARVGGPFELATLDGRPFSNADLAGKPYLVFFGFTHCPDICPTTLYELTGLLKDLGPDAGVVPLFMTVDPARDTSELLKAYMGAFDARIVALRGTPEQTAVALKAFAAYAKKVEGEGGDYTMEHTAGVILMDRAGKFAGKLDMHEPRDTQLGKLRRLSKL